MLKSKKDLIVIATISLILLSSILYAGSSDLIICYDPWPPSMIFPSKEDPKRGFVIDMLTDIFQSNGYSITFRKVPYIRAKVETEAGRCHIMAEVVPDENSNLLYPEMTTFPHQYSFFVKKGNPWKYNGISSLKGMIIADIIGYDYSLIDLEYDNYLKNEDNAKHIIQFAGKDAIQKIFRLITMGRVDAFAESTIVGNYIINKYGMKDKLSVAGSFPTPLVQKPGFSPKFEQAKLLMKLWDKGRREIGRQDKMKSYLQKYGITVPIDQEIE